MRATRLSGESTEYAGRRDELRLAEIELMRQRERVAELRRALPPGTVRPREELGKADLTNRHVAGGEVVSSSISSHEWGRTCRDEHRWGRTGIGQPMGNCAGDRGRIAGQQGDLLSTDLQPHLA